MNKFLIALLTGVTLGVLFAPAKGSSTRKKFNDGFDDLSERLADLLDEVSPAYQTPVAKTAALVPDNT